MGEGCNIEYKQHIGGPVFCAVSSEFKNISLRNYWKPEDASAPVPTRKGVTLKVDEWPVLMSIMEDVKKRFPALGSAEVCYISADHNNQLGAFACKECHPFDTEDF